MKCKKCGGDLGGLDRRVAYICLRVSGDEEDRSYFLCKVCDVYTVWIWNEPFFTDEDVMFSVGPLSREVGDEIIEKIRRCPSPHSVSCRCPTHEELSNPM